jgi:hypothetical protein
VLQWIGAIFRSKCPWVSAATTLFLRGFIKHCPAGSSCVPCNPAGTRSPPGAL